MPAISNILYFMRVYPGFLWPDLLCPPNFSTTRKTVALGWDKQSIRWVATTLQTVKSRGLRQITIRSEIIIENPSSDTALREWLDLDRFLSQLWTFHPIPLKIVHESECPRCGLGDLAPVLLPELTGRGIVDFVESGRTSFLSCSLLVCLD